MSDIIFTEQAKPSTPATAKWTLYFKTDGLYYLDDAGTEIGPLSVGGGGGGHVIQDNGTPMTARANLNIIGATVADDAGNDATDITVVGLTTTDEASSATPTINTDNSDVHEITALAEDITSMTTNLSGTPTNNEKLLVKILDDGTARAIAWGASFASTNNGTLPTTTTISKWLYVGFMWSASRSKWLCVGVAEES